MLFRSPEDEAADTAPEGEAADAAPAEPVVVEDTKTKPEAGE